MKKLSTLQPKDVWKFFKELDEKHGAYLVLGKKALALEETDDVSEPPGIVLDAKISRDAWIIFLQVLVALAGGRPVKIIPHSATLLRVLVGPKS